MNRSPSRQSSFSFNDCVHDLVTIALPLIISVTAGTIAYIALLEKVTRNLPVMVQSSYDHRMFWWVVAIDILITILFAGRLTAYVWRKEFHLEMRPPPLRIIRACGLIFCWSDQLTLMCAAPFRRLHVPKVSLMRATLPRITVPRFTMPRITLPRVELPRFTGFARTLRRRRRRMRIRVLWVARMITSLPHHISKHIQTWRTKHTTQIELPIPVQHATISPAPSAPVVLNTVVPILQEKSPAHVLCPARMTCPAPETISDALEMYLALRTNIILRGILATYAS